MSSWDDLLVDFTRFKLLFFLETLDFGLEQIDFSIEINSELTQVIFKVFILFCLFIKIKIAPFDLKGSFQWFSFDWLSHLLPLSI